MTRTPLAEATAEALAHLLRGIVDDPLRHARVLADGPFKFRQDWRKTFAGLPVNDDLAHETYFRLSAWWEMQMPGTTPAQFLSVAQPREAPVSADKVTDWKVESGSSAEASRRFYGGRHPQDYIDRVIAEDGGFIQTTES